MSFYEFSTLLLWGTTAGIAYTQYRREKKAEKIDRLIKLEKEIKESERFLQQNLLSLSFKQDLNEKLKDCALKSYIESYLNSFDTACIAFLRDEIDRMTFKANHINEIKTIQEDATYNIYLKKGKYNALRCFIKTEILNKNTRGVSS